MSLDLRSLPDNIKDWIFGSELAVDEAKYFAYVTPGERTEVQQLIIQAYLHAVTIPEFIAKLREIVPGARGRVLATDILGYNFVRISEWFPEEKIIDDLLALGGDPDDYKETRPLEDALDEAMAGVNVELIPPRTRETVMGKMTEFLNRKLDKASLLESMTKSQKIGGWGWNSELAIQVIDKLETKRVEGEKVNAVFVHKEDIEKRRVRRETVMEELKKELAALPESKKSAVPPKREFVAPSPVPTVRHPEQSEGSGLDSSASLQDDMRLPDPFDAILKKNLPRSAVAVASMPDPFEALMKEIEEEQQANMPLPDPFSVMLEKMMKAEPEKVMAMAHHGTVDVERPATPFELALHTSDLLLDNELREIEQRKDDLLKDLPESAIQVSATLDTLVDRIVAESGFTTNDAHLEKRVRNIISSRLRDIRSAEETAKLLAKISNGKMELKREMMEEIVKLTEQAFLEFQRKVIERGLQRERARRVRMREEVLEQKREDVFEAQQELNTRYKKVTGKDAVVSLPMPDEQAADAAVMGAMGENPIAEAPKKRVIPANEPGSPTNMIPDQVRDDKPPQVASQPQRQVKVTLSPGTMAPSTASKPKMNDVKYERVLAGPVQELRMMRLADFRRLSKDPKAAAEKVLAKIDLLGAENYEKKVQGVIAWKESPLMALYLAVTKEALDQGTPLVNILAAKKKTIPEMLTIEECQAIRELNAKLRY